MKNDQVKNMKKTYMAKSFFAIYFFILIIFMSGCLQPGDRETSGATTKVGRAGLSIETAIIIDAENEKEGVNKEYRYLDTHACADKSGIKDYGGQELLKEGNNFFDLVHVICNNGEQESYYFQIDSFFGKV